MSLTATTACSVERFPDFQIVLRPVLSFRQRMSDTPSPSKSPTPATLYACSSTLTTACSVERYPDFQILLATVLVLRPMMSDTTSPLKSTNTTLDHSCSINTYERSSEKTVSRTHKSMTS